jgi:hypothetical protein
MRLHRLRFTVTIDQPSYSRTIRPAWAATRGSRVTSTIVRPRSWLVE